MAQLSTTTWLRIVGGGFIAVAALLLLIWFWSDGEATTDAYITGHVHAVSARISNTVIEVRVDDNQHVRAGDVLVVLDPKDYLVSAEQAKAQIAGARAQAASAQAQIAQAEAAIVNAHAVQAKAVADFERASGLLNSGGVSKQSYDAADAAAKAARAASAGAIAQLAVATAARDNALAQIKVDEANLTNAQLSLAYTRITAPVDGYVGRKTVELGQRVAASQTLCFVVSDDVWVVANYKETQLRNISLGAPVSISLDALPGVALHGTVDSFSPASGAQFALLPPDNATGNFTKVVQRVPVKIRFNSDELRRYRSALLPGLSVETHIGSKR
jgi:membrane fusion protein (multidrug efflux system)